MAPNGPRKPKTIRYSLAGVLLTVTAAALLLGWWNAPRQYAAEAYLQVAARRSPLTSDNGRLTRQRGGASFAGDWP